MNLRSFRNSVLLALLAGSACGRAHAQNAAAGERETEAAAPAEEHRLEGQPIIVTAYRRGAVAGNIPPELELDAEDISGLGTSNIEELVDVLAPQIGTTPGGERPIVLVNGRRVSSFAEISRFPPESVERIDILPPEVALSYGYPVSQRVVNVVLRESFHAITGEVEQGFATDGGRGRSTAEVSVVRIAGESRLLLNAEYQHEAPLFESERNLVPATTGAPFDLLGNITAAVPGQEIDPALSALVGRPVTLAGVPPSAAAGAPSLADFVTSSEVANVTDVGEFRTMLPETDRLSVNAGLRRRIFGDVAASVNGRFVASESRSFLGLPSARLLVPAGNDFSPFADDVLLYRYFDAPGPLGRRTASRTAHLGVALNGAAVGWRWTFTGNFDHARATTRTDANIDPASIQARIDAGDPAFNPFAPVDAGLMPSEMQDRARFTTTSLDAEFVANGSPLALPAGRMTATVKAGFDLDDSRSETRRAGVVQDRSFPRDRATAQASFDVPIASRQRDVLAPLGSLDANFNVAVDRRADFGTLSTVGYGFRWSPTGWLGLHGSVTDSGSAPGAQQLGDPVIVTPNVRVFDFLAGESVDITRIEGGNPDLLAADRRTMTLRLQVAMPSRPRFVLNAEYTATRNRNPVFGFPTATPEVEAAFPDRFVRDETGMLVQIDGRPVNFARSEQAQVKWGAHLIMSLGSAPAAGPSRSRLTSPTVPGSGAPDGDERSAASDSPSPRELSPGGLRSRGPGGPAGTARLFLSLQHTFRLRDTLLIRPGLPELDLLDGSAAGGALGQPRHQIQFRGALSRNGVGIRVEADWQSGTLIRGNSDERLAFSNLGTMNAHLFVDLGRHPALLRRLPWLEATRVTLSADNIFNVRQRVRDANGETPLVYQPAFLDPLGRTVSLEIRKTF